MNETNKENKDQEPSEDVGQIERLKELISSWMSVSDDRNIPIKNEAKFEGVKVQDFAWAIKQLKQGQRVCRSGWNGKGMYLLLYTVYVDDEALIQESKQFRKFIAIKDAQDAFVPWVASQTDMLAEDWMLVG